VRHYLGMVALTWPGDKTMIIGSLLSISPEAFLFSIVGFALVSAVVGPIVLTVVNFIYDVLR
jgi:hypothetical protein